MKTLNSEMPGPDSARGVVPLRFEVVPSFCRSLGEICQGESLARMVDVAMATAAATTTGRLSLAVATRFYT